MENKLSLEKPNMDHNYMSFEKVFGAALVGAISGVVLYYIYNHLGEDTKRSIKETAMSGLKAQMAKYAQTPTV